jgi:hypothetical protein
MVLQKRKSDSSIPKVSHKTKGLFPYASNISEKRGHLQRRENEQSCGLFYFYRVPYDSSSVSKTGLD